jgi:hypothetical protein
MMDAYKIVSTAASIPDGEREIVAELLHDVARELPEGHVRSFYELTALIFDAVNRYGSNGALGRLSRALNAAEEHDLAAGL